MATTHGPFTFPNATTGDVDRFLYTDPVATDATLPQAANTARRWCWDNNGGNSTNIGPQWGDDGDSGTPEGYLYTEMTSPGAFNDVFELEFDTALDASAEQWQFNFATCQKGDDCDATYVVQINESGSGWVTVANGSFGGSGDPAKLNTADATVWTDRSVDLSESGANVDSSTLVRILITAAAAGTTWHNDIGIDSIEIVGTDLAEAEQDSFRFEDDDGSESGSTFLEAQNVDLTRGKEDPFRLRQGVQHTGDPAAQSVTLQYKENGDAAAEWRDVP